MTSEHTGALIGFANLGDINHHLQQFEQSLQGDNIAEQLAKSMLVLMVRGLFTKLQFPYAQFPCVTLVGHHIFNLFWEAVHQLERCTLKVIAATFGFDGATPNRGFMKLHSSGLV